MECHHADIARFNSREDALVGGESCLNRPPTPDDIGPEPEFTIDEEVAP